MKLSERIRQVRGYESQQVFATRVGCGIATLNRWERGIGRPHFPRHIDALADCGVERELLVAYSGEGVA